MSATCINCGNERKILARHLCRSCYNCAHRRGHVTMFPKLERETKPPQPQGTKNRSLVDCLDCGETKPNKGRGLCPACYGRHLYNGTLDEIAPREKFSATREDEIAAMVDVALASGRWVRRGSVRVWEASA